MPRGTVYKECLFSGVDAGNNLPTYREGTQCLCNVPHDIARCCGDTAKWLAANNQKQLVETAISDLENPVGMDKFKRQGLQKGIK